MYQKVIFNFCYMMLYKFLKFLVHKQEIEYASTAARKKFDVTG
ncbi:hypothetical protein DespoDRAFT_03228 [Desulfobacter postgatei 2ac9]|uniref:Uncharacterized protein n=1 Tax=Desulfobacter postgatei 2ac9 TaxID=879212 RepID=I5B696_9BACT|nr:hypothetical protein DespoDRAFT_03228 [Desulfobacter postgatei 2ac9]